MGVLRQYLASLPPAVKTVQEIVGDHDTLIALKSPVACDTETTGLNPWLGDRPYAFSFCDAEGRKAFVRGRVNPATREVEIPKRPWRSLVNFFSNASVTKVFHHAKFDIRMLESIGASVRGRIEETIFALHALNNMEPSFKLKRLGAKYVEIPDDDEKELRKATSKARLAAKKKGWKIAEKLSSSDDPIAADYWLAPEELLKRYAVTDAERTILLWLMAHGVMDEEGVRDTYEMELKLFPRTYAMETRGVKIEPAVVDAEIVNHNGALKKSLAEVQKWKPGINLNSPVQLQRFLYGTKDCGGLGVAPIYDKDTGNPTTDAEALQSIQHPFARLISRVRAHEKALSSFFVKYKRLSIPDPLNPGGRALHPDFQQVGPVTGRFACRTPNLQNVADSSGAGFTTEPIQARTPFGPRPGFVWYHFDFSQLELRIFADVAQEPNMLAAIHEGGDIHGNTARKIWGDKRPDAAIKAAVSALGLDGKEAENTPKAISEVARLRKREGKASPETLATAWLDEHGWDINKAESSIDKKNSRKKAKIINFLTIYGGWADAVASKLVCSKREAEDLLEEYHATFNRIRAYSEELSSLVYRDGFIRNRFNRKLWVDPDYAYRAVNYMVQGSAADLLKDRMLAVSDYLEKMRARGVEAYLVLTIHDEIVIEVRLGQGFPWFLRRIRRIMEDHGGRFGLPLPVDLAKTVTRWNEKKELKDFR